MKYFRRFFLYLILLIALIATGLQISGNGFLLRGVWIVYLHGETSATIDDLQYFDAREVSAPAHASSWKTSPLYNQRQLSEPLKSTLDTLETVGFLVLKNDEIIQEYYWDGYSSSSYSNSFSMAKSIVSMMTQIAIQKGYIKSWDQKAEDFLPDLKGPYKSKLRLRHLSNMSAGLDWNEHYTNPFDITAKTYYGRNVKSLMYNKVAVIEMPGKNFEYQSGATQYLGMALENATGKNLSTLASEWLWKPLGAQQNALWRLDDKDGTELGFCCFNSNLRDFARFGKLLLHKGNWDGVQILDSSFVKMATAPKKDPNYGYSFWLDNSHGSKVFYMRGILGQYIIVIPEKDLVIVRLGKHLFQKTAKEPHHPDFHIIIEEVLKHFG